MSRVSDEQNTFLHQIRNYYQTKTISGAIRFCIDFTKRQLIKERVDKNK